MTHYQMKIVFRAILWTSCFYIFFAILNLNIENELRKVCKIIWQVKIEDIDIDKSYI